MPSVPTFTWSQVEASNSDLSKDKLIVINDKVYSIGGDFVYWHPGGKVALSQTGRDATGAFDQFHSESVQEVLSDFYLGDIAPTERREASSFRKDIEKLQNEFQKAGLFEASKIYYFFKVLFNISLWAAAVSILHIFGHNTYGVLISASILAIFWQQCGWLAHDFLHHQVFKNRTLNNYMGIFVGNICQGFSVSWWKNKHCTHHSMPNVHLIDTDIDTMPFLAWSEHALEFFNDLTDKQAAKFLVSYQPILYFPILTLARLSWAFASIIYCITTPSTLFETNIFLFVERFSLLMHWGWYLFISFYYLSPMMAIVYIFVSQAICGFLLAIVFSINHNGMPILDTKEASKVDFYEMQVMTGRDVTSNIFNDWFTGGLNYQIEHHIWPTLPRHNFHLVTEKVQSLCKKHNVPYHSTSLVNGVNEIIQRLDKISKLAKKTKFQ
ncbi:hypothetical protein HDU92_004343 [Lobulomyces angularis]|nr:hypothetical protein HDU92_004343 [Lobulomyces angularis]